MHKNIQRIFRDVLQLQLKRENINILLRNFALILVANILCHGNTNYSSVRNYNFSYLIIICITHNIVIIISTGKVA